jgi:hypothetical protein
VMKTSFTKTLIFFLVLSLSSVLFLFAQTEEKDTSSREKRKSDTTEVKKSELPSKVAEIRIDEEGIFIRTQEGKELRLGKTEKEGETIIDKEGIKIGDLKIDLKQLKDLKIPPIEIEALEKSKRVSTISHDIIKVGRDIIVEESEKVDGDVVSVGGDVTVKGTVLGNVAAVGGDVFVDSTAVIEGDAVSVGGDVEKEPGAVIKGEKIRVRVGFLPKKLFKPTPSVVFPPTHMFRLPPFFAGFGGLALFARIIKIMLLLFLGIVVISIVPKNVAKVKGKIREDFLKSALMGLAAEILVIPVLLLLIVTIIGIPVAILVAPLLILAALILGYTGISYFIGEKLREGTSLKPDSPVMTLVIGILAVESVLLLARVVGIFGHFLFAFSWILTLVGWTIWYVAITVGFGASILTRLGTRPKEIKLAPAPPISPNSTPGGKTPV